MYKGCVYCLTCPEGKKYVGQSVDLNTRLRQHKHSPKTGGKSAVVNAIRNYGFDNFKVTILAEVEEKTEKERDDKLFQFEKHFVKEMNTIFPNGYNVSRGGQGNPGWKWDNEYREKILKSRRKPIGKINGMYGKKWAPEYREKVMESRKNFYNSDKSEELRKKLSERSKGENNYFYGAKGRNAPSAQEVYCFELNMIFPTIKQSVEYIHKEFGIKLTRSNVSISCDRSGKYTKFRKGVKGFNFRKTAQIVSYGNLVPSRFVEMEGVETIPERE